MRKWKNSYCIFKDADVFVVYCAFRKKEDFFDTPVSSNFLGIQTVYDLEVQTNVEKLTFNESVQCLVSFLVSFLER